MTRQTEDCNGKTCPGWDDPQCGWYPNASGHRPASCAGPTSPSEPVEAPRCEPRCGLCPRYCRNPPPPSEPVESREQPSAWDEANRLAEWCERNGSSPTPAEVRYIGALADQQQARLRAEAAREFESGNDWCCRALAAEGERDRARDFAADLEAENAHALAEVSRLREQGEREREQFAEVAEGWIQTAKSDPQSGDTLLDRCAYEILDVLRAILSADAREGE